MTAKTIRRRKAHCSSVRLRLDRPDSADALEPRLAAPLAATTSLRCWERVTVGL